MKAALQIFEDLNECCVNCFTSEPPCPNPEASALADDLGIGTSTVRVETERFTADDLSEISEPYEGVCVPSPINAVEAGLKDRGVGTDDLVWTTTQATQTEDLPKIERAETEMPISRETTGSSDSVPNVQIQEPRANTGRFATFATFAGGVGVGAGVAAHAFSDGMAQPEQAPSVVPGMFFDPTYSVEGAAQAFFGGMTQRAPAVSAEPVISEPTPVICGSSSLKCIVKNKKGGEREMMD